MEEEVLMRRESGQVALQEGDKSRVQVAVVHVCQWMRGSVFRGSCVAGSRLRYYTGKCDEEVHDRDCILP